MKPILVSLVMLLAACSKGAGDHAGHASADAGPPPSSAAASPAPAAQAPTGHEGHEPEARPRKPEAGEVGALPPGHVEVQIAADRVQTIGVRVGLAERASLGTVVRASAIVQADETREAHVHSKLMGWVQELFVAAVGDRVEEGEPLYSLYSQDLFAAQLEYLRARKSTPELATVARQRLALWDVPEDQIRLIERKGAQKAVIFRSPVTGTVIEKAVVQGHFIEPEMMIYRIADLSRVWILVSVYEYEVNRLDRGGVARVEVQGLAAPFLARVDYVYPTLDEATRTVKVRLVADNARGLLRPGSFAVAELPTRPVDAIWVPDSAVIDTGREQLVYVQLSEGRFRPVTVRVGRRDHQKAEILEGLRGGETVVISAQFLIDSESRLQGAGGGGHSGHQ